MNEWFKQFPFSADPLYSFCFSSVHLQKEHFLVELFDFKKELELSFLFDISFIQEGFSFRSLNRARKISAFLIDEQGHFSVSSLERLILALTESGQLFQPTGFNDKYMIDHFLKILIFLKNGSAFKFLNRFQLPVCYRSIEKLILRTLGLNDQKLTNAHLKRAVLCALLTPLRQNVGSCFATAPAILIQREDPERFLQDLYELVFSGKIKKVVSGIEYAVPLSPSVGAGDLRKNLLLQDSHKLPQYTPGLIALLEKWGVILEEDPLLKKGEKSARFIQSIASQKKSLSTHDLIEHYLKEKIGISNRSTFQQKEKLETFYEQFSEASFLFNQCCENALLKAWEFTLASFSEVKMEFSRWNLYLSLGLSHEEPGGIGSIIYRTIQEQLDQLNCQLEEKQKECQSAFHEVKSSEVLLKNAGSEGEMRRLKAEYQARVHHLRLLEELRDDTYEQTIFLSKLFVFLIEQYDSKFPEYFQEVYDPLMIDFEGDFYEDSPAGFRLVYKHGRTDPSLWTFIYSSEQYINTLIDFFISTERQMIEALQHPSLEKQFLEINTQIIHHLRMDVFLKSALHRMQKAHRNPSHPSLPEHQNFIETKPWAYVSGGTMTTLLNTYYRLENPFLQEEKRIENTTELLIFFLDTLKSLPPRITQRFLQDPAQGMLASSPSHAFILHPGSSFFLKGWQDNSFSYTWVRDEIIIPSRNFYEKMQLSSKEQAFLIERYLNQLPLSLASSLKGRFSLQLPFCSIVSFRNQLIDAFPSLPSIFQDGLDAYLYRSLPLVSFEKLKQTQEQLLDGLPFAKLEKTLEQLGLIGREVFTSEEVKRIAKASYLLAIGHQEAQDKSIFSFDLHAFIAQKAKENALAPPTPLLVADTNWTNYVFGFVVNPGTAELELWRLDRTLSYGVPMSQWRHWLNGSDKSPWVLYFQK